MWQEATFETCTVWFWQKCQDSRHILCSCWGGFCFEWSGKHWCCSTRVRMRPNTVTKDQSMRQRHYGHYDIQVMVVNSESDHIRSWDHIGWHDLFDCVDSDRYDRQANARAMELHISPIISPRSSAGGFSRAWGRKSKARVEQKNSGCNGQQMQHNWPDMARPFIFWRGHREI